MAQQQLEELHLVTVQHFLRIMGGLGVDMISIVTKLPTWITSVLDRTLIIT